MASLNQSSIASAARAVLAALTGAGVFALTEAQIDQWVEIAGLVGGLVVLVGSLLWSRSDDTKLLTAPPPAPLLRKQALKAAKAPRRRTDSAAWGLLLLGALGAVLTGGCVKAPGLARSEISGDPLADTLVRTDAVLSVQRWPDGAGQITRGDPAAGTATVQGVNVQGTTPTTYLAWPSLDLFVAQPGNVNAGEVDITFGESGPDGKLRPTRILLRDVVSDKSTVVAAYDTQVAVMAEALGRVTEAQRDVLLAQIAAQGEAGRAFADAVRAALTGGTSTLIEALP